MTTLPGLEQLLLPTVIAVAGIASAVVVALAITALYRRRSRPYLLVTLALAALLVRTFSGALTLNGHLGADAHHLIEHGLDAISILFLLGAVYFARTVDRREEVTGE